MSPQTSTPPESDKPGYPSHPGNSPDTLAGGNLTHDLQAFWFLLLDRLWLIGAILLVGMILTAAYVLTRPKLYEARATVQVQDQDQSAIKTDTYRDNQTGLEQLNTVVGKFQSRPLLASVLCQAGLISSNALNALSYDFTGTSPSIITTNTTEESRTNTLVAPRVPSPVFSAAASTLSTDEMKVINSYQPRVKTTLRRNTRLIDIKVTDRDPVLASKLANLMIENYLKQDFSIKATTGKSQGEFFQAECNRLAKKLQASEQALQDYREQVGTVDMSDPSGSPDDALLQYQRQLTAAQAEVIRCKSAYDQSLKMGTNVEDLLAYTEITSDPQVQSCQSAIAQKEVELVQIKQQYREKNPKYILAVNTLAGLKEQYVKTVLDIRNRIQESFRLPYENALATKKGLDEELAQAQTRSLDLSQKAIHYNLLARDVAVNRAMFNAVSQRLSEMSVSSQLAPVNISIVEPASPSDIPSSPKIKALLFLGFFGSLGFALGLVLLVDKFNTAFRTVEDAENYLQLPVLGAIPRLELNPKDYHDQMVVVNRGAHSAELELFRSLRVTVSVQGREQERRSFLFTSSFPREGKTFTSCNFAASLAQQGLRTLIFDLDLRRSRLEEFLTGETKHIPGLAEVLQGKEDLIKVVQTYPQMPNLFWVPAGELISNPSELLSQGRFKPVLEQALKDYDRVVIDTSPLHPVKDALLVAGDVSTVIVLVNGSTTARKAVAKTLQWLRNINAPVAGVVLNLLPRRRRGKGYNYYEYHGYSYGKYAREEKAKG